MKVKILKCDWTEYEGQVVDIIHKYYNGIDFVTKKGLIFVKNGDYEYVENTEVK